MARKPRDPKCHSARKPELKEQAIASRNAGKNGEEEEEKKEKDGKEWAYRSRF